MRERFRLEGVLSEDISLALGVVGAFVLVAGGVLYGVIPELRGWALALMLVGVASLVAFGVLGRNMIAQFVATRQGRYGLNTVILIVAVTVILGLLNFVSANVSSRIDVTATRQFTLASQTQRALGNLAEPVSAYGFFALGDPAAVVAEGLLREYALATDNFEFEIVDPETDPAKARQFQVDQAGVIVFSTRDRVTRTNSLTEQALTAALMRAAGEGLKTVCFTTGHRERSILGTTDLGMNLAQQALERELYLVKDFSILTEAGVPDDCAVVIVAGPTADLETSDTVDEGLLLRSYLGSGGNVLFLLTPETPSSWRTILLEGGIAAGGGTVIDPSSYVQPDRTTPQIRTTGYFAAEGFRHPITDPLIEESLETFFPVTTRVAPLPPDQQFPGATTIPLMFTTERSWLESDTEDLDTATYDQATDLRGPISIAVASEFPTLSATGQQDSGRLVAIGNTAFVGNLSFFSLGNGDLFINSVNWLTEQEELISIRPKITAPRLLILSQREADWILYSSVGLLPLLIASAGAWVWWRRR